MQGLSYLSSNISGGYGDKSLNHLLESARLDSSQPEIFRVLGDYYKNLPNGAKRAVRCYQKAVLLNCEDEEAGVSINYSKLLITNWWDQFELYFCNFCFLYYFDYEWTFWWGHIFLVASGSIMCLVRWWRPSVIGTHNLPGSISEISSFILGIQTFRLSSGVVFFSYSTPHLKTLFCSSL